MSDKNGTPQQQRNVRFSSSPATATGTCPFNGPDIAIVPVRYALDRSRYDVAPDQLTPLPENGEWIQHPQIQTRSYTLRQLRTGYVYVYDETAKTLHEYMYSAEDGSLARVTWASTDIGQDERNGADDSESYLLYPRQHNLHIAYSKDQWTWRVCEHMRSNASSRRVWMQQLDLSRYCISMAEPHTLPLPRIAEAVADIDPGAVNQDKRFADSACPLQEPAPQESYTTDDGTVVVVGKLPDDNVVPLAADTVWLGSVPDPASTVLIALNDPLAVLEDFGMQLIADQTAWLQWQNEHEHKLNIARYVEGLCGVSEENLPPAVRGDVAKQRAYQVDLDEYLGAESLDSADALTVDPSDPFKGTDAVERSVQASVRDQQFKARYGSLPNDKIREDWEARSKWRNEVNFEEANAFLQEQQPVAADLLQRVRETQQDLKTWAVYIGTDPLSLFVDTGNPKSLLPLQSIMAELLTALGQDAQVSAWLAEEDLNAKTLFGLVRFGFSEEIKAALTIEANNMVQGFSDVNAIGGRVGELNAFLTHDDIANKPWMKALSKPAQDTLAAITVLAKDTGKQVFEQTLLALLPSDSRLAQGKQPSIGAMLRNMVVSHLLIDHPDRIKLDARMGDSLRQWQKKVIVAKATFSKTLNHWFHPGTQYDRRSLGRNLTAQERTLKQLAQEMPAMFDYQNNRYVQLLRDEIHKFFSTGLNNVNQWQTNAKAITARWGVNASAISWGVAFLNLFNTVVTYELVTRDGSLDKKDLAKIGSSGAYTGVALMSIFVETKWRAINGLTTEIRGRSVSVFQRSARFWEASVGETAGWGQFIKGFGIRLVGLGGFTVVAAGLELWDTQDDLESVTDGRQRVLLNTKIATLAIMSFIGLGQLIAGLAALAGSGGLIPLVMNPWVAGAALILGVVYLAASLALNYFKRDAIGQWLHKCCWSRHPSDRFADTAEGRSEENRSFLEIQISPSLFVKPTYSSESVYMHREGYYRSVERQNGAWVQLLVPEALRGQVLKLNLTATHRPLYVLPVSILDGPLDAPFVDNGQYKTADILGNANDERWQRAPNAALYPLLPPQEQDVVWQTWVPLTDDAQFLELQLWYPIELLSASEGDRGYRYQLELEAKGRLDQKDTRISGLDSSTLQVQTLGGRDQAIELPVPY